MTAVVSVIRFFAATTSPEGACGSAPTPIPRREPLAMADDRDQRFEELYGRYGATIYARCRQVLSDGALAHDATQEVFLRAYRALDRIRGPREAFTWLYRTATNYCLNEIRNGRMRPALVAVMPERSDPRAELRITDQDLVKRLVRQLPEELAMAAWLYHVDELDQAEIAEICGVSRRTVIARLARFSDQARAFIERSERAIAK
jgi:RNA polymerase sigma-70 factor (ECF subfamily)